MLEQAIDQIFMWLVNEIKGPFKGKNKLYNSKHLKEKG